MYLFGGPPLTWTLNDTQALNQKLLNKWWHW